MNDIFSHLPIFWYINILKIFVVGMGMLKNVMNIRKIGTLLVTLFFFGERASLLVTLETINIHQRDPRPSSSLI